MAAVACSTFQGPGPLVASGQKSAETSDSAIVEPTVRKPALSMNGERGFSSDPESVRFQWPVDEATMSRGFLAAPVKRKKPHWGIDLANHKGTPIMAANNGKVIYAGHSFKGYGKLVIVEHGDDWATFYAHLNKILVKEGQDVAQGEKIAEMGRTGHATGNHLHFEVRHLRKPVNPLAYLPSTSGPPRTVGQNHAITIQLSSQLSQPSSSSEPPPEP